MALSKINTNQIVDGAVATADIADGLITTAKLADGAVTTAKTTDSNITTAKIADDAVTQAKIGADAVGTTELANDVAISTSGAITTTGAFTSVGIDDNADATTITIDSSERVGIGTASPSAQFHIDESASNSYATMRLEGSNRGGQIDMYQGSTIVSKIYTDQSGNVYIGSSGGYGQVAIDSTLQLNSYNKGFHVRNSTFLTQVADDASRTFVASSQGLVIVTAYSEGITFIGRHEFANPVQIISANGTWSNSDTDGKFCILSGTNDYSVTLKNRIGGARDFKAIFIGTYQ